MIFWSERGRWWRPSGASVGALRLRRERRISCRCAGLSYERGDAEQKSDLAGLLGCAQHIAGIAANEPARPERQRYRKDSAADQPGKSRSGRYERERQNGSQRRQQQEPKIGGEHGRAVIADLHGGGIAELGH